jgi:hypothetical protein
MERKASDFKYANFFEQDEDFDVLFFGTSHVINGIFPMELWNEYGIVSYNFGGHGNEIATSYWDNIDAVIDIRNKDIFKNTWIRSLLENLGVDVNMLNENTDFIIIKNGGEEAIVMDNFKHTESSTDTELGNIMLDYQEDSEKYSLYIDSIEYINATIEDDTSMQICVLRNGTVIDNVKFIYTIDQNTKDIDISDVQR